MLTVRDTPLGAAPTTPSPIQPRPPGFDPGMYSSVPIFNKQADLLAISIPFMALSWIFSALRLYVRLVILRAPGWDDIFMILALLSSTFCSIFLGIATAYGLGRSMYTLTSAEIEQLIKIMYIGNFPYPLSVTFIKIACLFQYLRIFRAGSKSSILCECLIPVVTLWGLVFSILTWVPCIPLEGYWDFSVTDAKCWGFGARQWGEFMHYFVSQATTTAVLDFIIFILPAHLYFKPSTQKKTRITLLCLFSLGLTVIMCSIWRMAYVIQMERAGSASFDPTWYSPTAAGLANIEAHLAVSCAALPVFWPSLEKKWNKIFVTHEVSITTEYGQFPSRTKDIELQPTTFDKDLMPGSDKMPDTWEPFVGDETSGLGESETVIESLAAVKRSGRVRELFRCRTGIALPQKVGDTESFL